MSFPFCFIRGEDPSIFCVPPYEAIISISWTIALTIFCDPFALYFVPSGKMGFIFLWSILGWAWVYDYPPPPYESLPSMLSIFFRRLIELTYSICFISSSVVSNTIGPLFASNSSDWNNILFRLFVSVASPPLASLAFRSCIMLIMVSFYCTV